VPQHAIRPEGITAGQYSPVVESDGFVFLSGQVPLDADGKLVSDDFAVQARQVFTNMGRCLSAAGCGFTDVLKVTTYLADLGDAASYAEIYGEFFDEPYPARATLQAGLAAGFKIEIEAIAHVPEDSALHGSA
jgi:2-iminobutanoate/2-iminopropanoate deaminase